MNGKRGRGRPPKAAQSLDEALHAVYDGRAPSRPRNQHERDAASKLRKRGRPSSAASNTRAAAELALYTIQGGQPKADAVKVAAAAWHADPSNVRKYVREATRRLMVTTPPRRQSWVPAPVGGVPFVVRVEDGPWDEGSLWPLDELR